MNELPSDQHETAIRIQAKAWAPCAGVHDSQQAAREYAFSAGARWALNNLYSVPRGAKKVPAPAGSAFIAAIAEAFIQWPLPESVCADLCATKQSTGRIGTNLLSFAEAQQMASEVVIPALCDHVHALHMEITGLSIELEKKESGTAPETEPEPRLKRGIAQNRRFAMHNAVLQEQLEKVQTAIKRLGEIKDGKTYFEGSPTNDPECFARWKELNDALFPKASKADPNEKKPRLFYYEEAYPCWTPAPDRVENLISLDLFPDEEERISIEFKRCDLSDKEMDELPEV